jgi:hypothetical protein
MKKSRSKPKAHAPTVHTEPGTATTTPQASEHLVTAGRWKLLVCSLLVLGTLGLYWRAIGYDFLDYDDEMYVTRNPYVRGGLTLAGIKWAFQSTFGVHHPLTWLSLMVDAQLFGVHPWGFHFRPYLSAIRD